MAYIELVTLDGGSLTPDKYIMDVFGPYSSTIGNKFTLMHGNTRPHVERIVIEYLQEVNIPVLGWAANNPNLNPIDHVT